MQIKVALNGARPKTENRFIPHSLDEIEKEVSALFRNGHSVFHIHFYDENDKESLKPRDVNSLVKRIKNISPEIKLGISTGDWIEPDLHKRISYIKNWNVLPDFVSVNIIEDNAVEISKILIEKGILIEAGLNEVKAADKFAKSSLINNCLRVLIEPEEEILPDAIKTINEIENVLNSNNINVKRLLHGFDSVAWEILREAKKRGYDSRIGMEDTIYLENGEKVKSNLELIEYAVKMV